MQNYIPQDKLIEVKRVLYGANRGAPVQAMPLNQRVHEAAASAGFDVQGYKFTARQEQNRQPRTVKIGLIQNSIKSPTTAPYAEQTKVRMYACRSEVQSMIELVFFGSYGQFTALTIHEDRVCNACTSL